MACTCGLDHCPECMGGSYVPPPPPRMGSEAWKDEMAFTWMVEKKYTQTTGVYKLPRVNGYDLGYLVVRYYKGEGTDYFRVRDIIQC